MAKFNGHKNWNHWNVGLWFENDEGLYRLASICLRSTSTKPEAARMLLPLLGAKTPDGAPYSFSSVLAALRGL
jgi:hypothetical protein